MARYLFHHRHQPHECSIVFASFKDGQSPPRHHAMLAYPVGCGALIVPKNRANPRSRLRSAFGMEGSSS